MLGCCCYGEEHTTRTHARTHSTAQNAAAASLLLCVLRLCVRIQDRRRSRPPSLIGSSPNFHHLIGWLGHSAWLWLSNGNLAVWWPHYFYEVERVHVGCVSILPGLLCLRSSWNILFIFCGKLPTTRPSYLGQNSLYLEINKSDYEVTFRIENIAIERVDDLKFLGVQIDRKLSWKSHINLVKRKMSKTIAVLYRSKDT